MIICFPMQETLVQNLGQEDPLDKEMASHSCLLAWKIPWTEEPGGLQSMGSQKSWTRLSNGTTTNGKRELKLQMKLRSTDLKIGQLF